MPTRPESLPHRPRPQPGELHAADADQPAQLGGRRLPRSSRGDPRPAAPDLERSPRAVAPAGKRAGGARHRRRRHGFGDPAEHAADDRSALRRADDRRGAEHHQHPPRCRHHRVHARALRRQGADHRHASSRRWSRQALAQMRRRPGRRCRSWSTWTTRCTTARRAPGRDRVRRLDRGRRSAAPGDAARATNGTRSASTTPPAPPAIRRAWWSTIAAPTSTRSTTSSAGICRVIPIYLWTLPMFHCNGWCFPWTIAAVAGTHVCLRRVEAKAILDAIREHKVSHYCGAPIVHSMLISAPRRTQAKASTTRSSAWWRARRRRPR